jgi:hypothetical protein
VKGKAKVAIATKLVMKVIETTRIKILDAVISVETNVTVGEILVKVRQIRVRRRFRTLN